jgi:aspartate 1-decarboxylase
MLRTMLKSKIHRAVVTQVDLDYMGSITIDKNLLDASGIYEGEKVHVVNLNNGQRFETYTIAGEAGSGIIGINGAAARLCCVKDKVIIISYGLYTEEELSKYKTVIVQVDENNKEIN